MDKLRDEHGEERTVAEVKNFYGDHVNVYEKDGTLYYDAPSYEDFVEGTIKPGRPMGGIHHEAAARKGGYTLQVLDEKGNVEETYNDGQGTVRQVRRTKNFDGTTHLVPIVDGAVVELPQDQRQGAGNNCAAQCYTFFQNLKDEDLDTAKAAAASPEKVNSFVEALSSYATWSPELREKYESGAADVTENILSGTPNYNGK